MSLFLHLITLLICIAIIIGFRQSDKNNRSIEKARRFGDKIKDDLNSFINEKKVILTDLTAELSAHQNKAIVTVKRLDDVYKQFLDNTAAIENRTAAIQEIDKYIAKSDQTIQKLMDMTALAEKNLTSISGEADFVESLAREISSSKKELADITKQIPELQNKFIEMAEESLEEYKREILDNIHTSISDVENRLSFAQKSADDILEQTSLKLTELYEELYASAADRASSLQDLAFTKLQEQTAEKITGYKRELEETTGYITLHLNEKLQEAKQIADSFKTDLEKNSNGYAEKINSDFSGFQQNVQGKILSLTDKLKELENAVSVKSDELSTELNKTESVMRSQFNSLASNFQDNINSIAKFTDKKLADFRLQTETRFVKFEQTISNVDTLNTEIQKSQDAIKEELLKRFSVYASSLNQTQQNFSDDFTAKLERIQSRVTTIDNGIDELKSKAYANVSEKLQMFEDEFFADLAKRSEAINLSFEQWKEDVSANMSLLASENESARKDVEEKYRQELKTRIAKLSEEYRLQFAKLDEKVIAVENTLNTRITSADETAQQQISAFREEINHVKQKSIQYMDAELNSYKSRLEDAIKDQTSELTTGSKFLQEQVNAIKQDLDIDLQTIKENFEMWKDNTNQQFSDARTLFDDKITNFADLTQKAIKNFDSKYDAQYQDFIAKTETSFEGLQDKIQGLDVKVNSVNKELNQQAEEVLIQFKNETEKTNDNIEKRMRDVNSSAAQSIQEINDMIRSVTKDFDEMQGKVREKIQEEANRLSSMLVEIDKKQNAFINQTNVFKKADELKAALEKDIANLKNEITRFDIYRNAMDELSLKYEKVTQLEDEANKKIARFMSERKNIDILEAEFLKLTALSDSMDKKVLNLTTVNDDLQQYQVNIRKMEESIGDINTKYDRLEKKQPVLEQALSGIDSAFENLSNIENDIKKFKNDVNSLPSEIEKIQLIIETLVENQGRADEVCEKIVNIDSILSELNVKFDDLKHSRSWLAATETRLQDISRNSEAQLKLMADLYKSEKFEQGEKGNISVSTRENVLKLSRQGWKPDEIANALKLSLGEVQLILEFVDEK